MKAGKVRADGNKHFSEKNGGYMPSSLGSSVGSQAVGREMLWFYDFNSVNSKA